FPDESAVSEKACVCSHWPCARYVKASLNGLKASNLNNGASMGKEATIAKTETTSQSATSSERRGSNATHTAVIAMRIGSEILILKGEPHPYTVATNTKAANPSNGAT